jgi:hypothetical protein
MIPLAPPPPLEKLLLSCSQDTLVRLFREAGATHQGRYLHWDKLLHLTPPEELSAEEWWFGIKLARRQQFRTVPLRNLKGEPFHYTLPDCVLKKLHHIDSLASGRLALSEQVATEENRDRFIFNSLVEEAITSSQLEGAGTTRQVAADMIRYERRPRDKSERMILHRTLTAETLEDPSAVGRDTTETHGNPHRLRQQRRR